MPYNRLIGQIDDELVEAKKSLVFWRDQIIVEVDSPLLPAITNRHTRREVEITHLVADREALVAMRDSTHPDIS
jgi:hypothetical protein